MEVNRADTNLSYAIRELSVRECFTAVLSCSARLPREAKGAQITLWAERLWHFVRISVSVARVQQRRRQRVRKIMVDAPR